MRSDLSRLYRGCTVPQSEQLAPLSTSQNIDKKRETAEDYCLASGIAVSIAVSISIAIAIDNITIAIGNITITIGILLVFVLNRFITLVTTRQSIVPL